MLGQSDQSMYLDMARLLLDGRMPYVDCFDNNPPLIIYFNVIPVVVATALRAPLPLALDLTVTALWYFAALFTVWLCYKRKDSAQSLPLLFCSVVFAAFNQSQTIDSGQREHLFVIMTFPYIANRLLANSGKVSNILSGIFCGLGISLKHYFLLPILAFELVVAMRSPTKADLPLASKAALAVIAVYLLHFAFLPHAMLAGFFDFVIPIYKAGYDYYTNSFAFNIATFFRLDICAFVALTAFFVWRGFSWTPAAFAVTGWTALAIYVFAGQSWQYHLLPVIFSSQMLAALAIYELACPPDPSAFQIASISKIASASALRRAAVCGWLTTILIFAIPLYRLSQHLSMQTHDAQVERYDMARLGYSGTCLEYEIDPVCDTIVENSTPGDTILFISRSIAPGYPALIQTGRKPASRYIHGMLYTVLKYTLTLSRPDKAAFETRMKAMLDDYAADFEKYKPALVFVEPGDFFAPLIRRLNLAAYEKLPDQSGLAVYKRKAVSP